MLKLRDIQIGFFYYKEPHFIQYYVNWLIVIYNERKYENTRYYKTFRRT